MRFPLVRSTTFSLVTLVTLLAVAPVHAQITFDEANRALFVTGDATINNDTRINPNTGQPFPNGFGVQVFVGKDNANDFNTLTGPITLTVANGAIIDGSFYANPDQEFENYFGLSVFGTNAVNYTGGQTTFAYAFDNSAVSVSGGNIGTLSLENNVSLTMTNGTIGTIRVFDNTVADISGGTVTEVDAIVGTVNISGGTIERASAFFENLTSITGGNVTYVDTYENSITNISAGDIFAASSFVNGVTNVSGGSVFSTYAYETGRVNILGGLVDFAYSADDALTNITGGNVKEIGAYENGIFNVQAGLAGTSNIRLFNDGVVNLFGNFTFSSAGTGSDDEGSYTLYTLTGTLQNGQTLTSVNVFDYDGGLSISDPNAGTGNLRFLSAAPEPGTLALVLVGAFGFIAKRRRSK